MNKSNQVVDYYTKKGWDYGQFHCDVHKKWENGYYLNILAFYHKQKLIEKYWQICRKGVKKFE